MIESRIDVRMARARARPLSTGEVDGTGAAAVALVIGAAVLASVPSVLPENRHGS